jgi:Flp pilus assembly protein TadG
MKHKKESGQSFVELSLSLVVMLIMLAGTVDLGRAFYAYIALRDAAQEAALYGALNPTDTSGIQSRGMSNLSTRVDTSDVVITPTTTGVCANSLNSIEVTVQYGNFLITTPFLGRFLGSQTIDLEASVNNTILNPPC